MQFKEWLYNEVDWEGAWKDVQKECINTDALVAYLNDVISNRGKKTKDRKKFPATMPYVHAFSRLFGTKPEIGDELDVDEFIKRITTRPNNVVNRNEKMERSGMPNEFVYKTGVPAFRGIVYDIEEGKFYVLNTCPGAGECVAICYARHNRYIQYPESYDSMTRRLNYMLNFPDKYEEMLYDELKSICEEHGAKIGYEPKVLFRWNDSGDFFSRKYRLMAHNVMRKLTRDGYNISDAAYTKVADMVNDNPDSMKMAYSSGGKRSEADKVGSEVKTSKWIPKGMFAGLDLRKIADKQKLKSIIASKFGYDEADVIAYGEMMRTSLGASPRWHVIVTPEDGDDALHRTDVKTILLTQH